MSLDTKKSSKARDDWSFVPRRGALTDREVTYWRNHLDKLLKVGIELEYNLPDKKGTCARDNQLCPCTATFVPLRKQPNTNRCFEQCGSWDMTLNEKGTPKYPNDGNCPIAKAHGCAGIYCSAFKSPCPSCDKYDRGCNSCPELYDPRKDPKNIRTEIARKLKPTNFVGEYGHHGVYNVCKDNSLLGDGGVEVATVGRRPQFMAIYESMKNIMQLCEGEGAFTDERCSVHVHLLASYLTAGFREGDRGAEKIRGEITELEKPLPEVVLANFHQLIRRFHCALIWMGVAGRDINHLTRWEKFRRPILPYSAVQHRMPQVVELVSKASKQKAKYAMINYEQIQFDEITGDVSRLHLEARYLDGMLAPSVVAAHAILIYAIMLKAVEISRYGLLEAGNEAYMKRQNEMLKRLCNNDGDWGGSRHSDTSAVSDYIPELIDQSLSLIRLVKNVLAVQAPADRILRELAKKPVALRLIEGNTWKQIEADLGPSELDEQNPLHQDISRVIDTSTVGECETLGHWLEETARTLAETRQLDLAKESLTSLKDKVEAYVQKHINLGKLSWSPSLGGIIAHNF